MKKTMYNCISNISDKEFIVMQNKDIIKEIQRDLDNFNFSDFFKYSFFEYVKKKTVNKKSPRKCIVENCNNKTIKRSHTVQKSIIENISENGHVLSPKSKFSVCKMFYNLDNVGVDNALVFPGFCTLHEKDFFSYEKNKMLKENEDFKLQLLRTIYKEIVKCEIDIETLISSRASIFKKIQNEFNKLLKQKYKGEIKLKEININNLFLKEYEKNVMTYKQKLEQIMQFYKIFNQEDVEIEVIKIPFQIPIVIAGICDFNIYKKQEDKQMPVLSLVNCIPYNDRTQLIFCYEEANQKAKDYIKWWTQTPLMIINLIENIMVKETEEWVIKPSVWYDIDKNNRQQILNDLFFCLDSRNTDYSLSIFNSLRENMISLIEKDIYGREVDSSLYIHLEHEKKKLKRRLNNICPNYSKSIARYINKRFDGIQ